MSRPLLASLTLPGTPVCMEPRHPATTGSDSSASIASPDECSLPGHSRPPSRSAAGAASPPTPDSSPRTAATAPAATVGQHLDSPRHPRPLVVQVPCSDVAGTPAPSSSDSIMKSSVVLRQETLAIQCTDVPTTWVACSVKVLGTSVGPAMIIHADNSSPAYFSLCKCRVEIVDNLLEIIHPTSTVVLRTESAEAASEWDSFLAVLRRQQQRSGSARGYSSLTVSSAVGTPEPPTIATPILSQDSDADAAGDDPRITSPNPSAPHPNDEFTFLFVRSSPKQLQQHMCQGGLRGSAMRSLAWKVVLGCVPTSCAVSTWSGFLAHQRRGYDTLVQRHTLVESSAPEPPATSRPHTLQVLPESRHLVSTIDKDVERTFSDLTLFHSPVYQAMLRRVLYVWAAAHPAISYCQGMSEVAAVLIMVMRSEQDFWLSWRTAEPPVLPVIQNLCDPQFIEADTYLLLDQIMRRLYEFYVPMPSRSDGSVAGSGPQSSPTSRTDPALASFVAHRVVAQRRGSYSPMVTPLSPTRAISIKAPPADLGSPTAASPRVRSPTAVKSPIRVPGGAAGSDAESANATHTRRITLVRQLSAHELVHDDTHDVLDRERLMQAQQVGAIDIAFDWTADPAAMPSRISLEHALHFVQNDMLAAVDPQLSELLGTLGIEPAMYLLRWLRVMLVRELSLKTACTVWDAIFSVSPEQFDLLPFLCIVLLFRLKPLLIEVTDTPTALHMLNSGAKEFGTVDAITLVREALALREDLCGRAIRWAKAAPEPEPDRIRLPGQLLRLRQQRANSA